MREVKRRRGESFKDGGEAAGAHPFYSVPVRHFRAPTKRGGELSERGPVVSRAEPTHRSSHAHKLALAHSLTRTHCKSPLTSLLFPSLSADRRQHPATVQFVVQPSRIIVDEAHCIKGETTML